jgi:phosphatidylinositol dimannoside acyltransferase
VPDGPGRASYLAYRAGAEAARALPPAIGWHVVRMLAFVMRSASGPRRRLVRRHLIRVTAGELHGAALRRATTQVFRNYGRYWMELFRLDDDVDAAVDRFTCDGHEHLNDALALGRGAIVALPHLGNWDVAGAWLARQGHPLTVVVERLEPPELFEWFVAQRRKIGMHVIPLGNGAGSRVARVLRDGHVVCLVSDRDVAGDGVPVRFFGSPTTMPSGPAMLAARLGVPILPAGVFFESDGRHRARILPALSAPAPGDGAPGRLQGEVARLTQELAAHFEELIALAPDQWLVLQPVWSDELDGAETW